MISKTQCIQIQYTVYTDFLCIDLHIFWSVLNQRNVSGRATQQAFELTIPLLYVCHRLHAHIELIKKATV